MEFLFVLTQSNSGMFRVLGPIAKALGYLMNGIYVLLNNAFNIQNIALTIIIFTIVVYLCLLPLTYQQQKFSKMSQIMNPEIQAVQKKYKNRRDSVSVQAMNEETQAIYRKYGVNPSGSCIFMVIQLLILFPLYRVIYNVPAYVTSVKETFTDVVNNIMATTGYESTMQNFLTTVADKNSVFRGIALNFDGDATATADSIIDVLYKCTSDNWALLGKTFSGFSDVISSTQSAVEHFNNFLGASIVYSPKVLISTSFHEGHFFLILIGILIPIISAATQFLNIRLMPQQASAGGQQEAMASQMKMMNYFMPIYSFFIVFFLPIGVGIYWIAGALIRVVQQIVINKRLDKIDLAKLVKENEAKNAAKEKARIEKKGVSGQTISNAARINARQIDNQKRKTMADKANAASKKSSGYSNDGKKFKEGSMAAKANKVREYNERNTK